VEWPGRIANVQQSKEFCGSVHGVSHVPSIRKKFHELAVIVQGSMKDHAH